MAKEGKGSYLYQFIFDADVSPIETKIKNIFKEAQETAREDGKLEFRLATDPKSVENLIKEVEKLDPQVAASIKLNYDSKTAREFRDTLVELITQGVKDSKKITNALTNYIKYGINDVKKISIDDFFDAHGGSGSKTKNSIAKVINEELSQLKNFSFQQANLSEINDYVTRIRQVYSIIDEYEEKYNKRGVFNSGIGEIYNSLADSLLNNNLAQTIDTVINDDVNKLKTLIKRLGIATDEINDGLGGQTSINVKASVDLDSIQDDLLKRDFKIKVKPEVDGDSIKKVAKQWEEANEKMSRYTQSGERFVAFNDKTGYVGNAFYSDELEGTRKELVDEILDSITEEVNATMHMHPHSTRVAAFSDDDIERAFELLVERGIDQIYVQAGNEIAHLDLSGVDPSIGQDLVKLYSEKSDEVRDEIYKNSVTPFLENVAKTKDGLVNYVTNVLNDVESIFKKDSSLDLILKNAKNHKILFQDIKEKLINTISSEFDNGEFEGLDSEGFYEELSGLLQKVLSEMYTGGGKLNKNDENYLQIRSILDKFAVELENKDISRFDDETQSMFHNALKEALDEIGLGSGRLSKQKIDEMVDADINVKANVVPDPDSIITFVKKIQEAVDESDPVKVKAVAEINGAEIGQNTNKEVNSEQEPIKVRVTSEHDVDEDLKTIQKEYNEAEPIKYKVIVDTSDIDKDVKDIQEKYDEDEPVQYHIAPNLSDMSGLQETLQTVVDKTGVEISVDIKPNLKTDELKNGNSILKKTIHDITESENILYSTEKPTERGHHAQNNNRRERAFYYNSQSGWAGNAYTYGDKTAISGQLKKALYEYTKKQAEEISETIDGFFHSHPERIAAFSPADIRNIVVDRQNFGVKEKMVASAQQVAKFNARSLSDEEIKYIADSFEAILEDRRNQDEAVKEIRQKYKELYSMGLDGNDEFQLVVRDSLEKALEVSSKRFNKDFSDVLQTMQVEDYTQSNGLDIQIAITPDLNSIPEFMKTLQNVLDEQEPVKIKAVVDANGVEITPLDNGDDNKGEGEGKEVQYKVKAKIDPSSIDFDVNTLQEYYDNNVLIHFNSEPKALSSKDFTMWQAVLQTMFDEMDHIKYKIEPLFDNITDDIKAIQNGYDSSPIQYYLWTDYEKIKDDIDAIKSIFDSSNNISIEDEAFLNALQSFKKVIDEKNQAFISEKENVDSVTQYEITKLQELIDKLIEVENEVKKLQEISSLENLKDTGEIAESLKRLSEVDLSNLSNLSGIEVISKFTTKFAQNFKSNVDIIKQSIDDLVQAFSGQSDDTKLLLTDIKEILSKSEELANLANILGQSIRKLKELQNLNATMARREADKQQEEHIKLIEEEKKKQEELFETVNKINDGIVNNTYRDEFKQFEDGFKKIGLASEQVEQQMKSLTKSIRDMMDSSKSMEERAQALTRYTETTKVLNAMLKQGKADYKNDKNYMRTINEGSNAIATWINDAYSDDQTDKIAHKYAPDIAGIKYNDYKKKYQEWYSTADRLNELLEKIKSNAHETTEAEINDIQTLTIKVKDLQSGMDEMINKFGGEQSLNVVNGYTDKVNKLKGIFDGLYDESDWNQLNSQLALNVQQFEQGSISVKEFASNMDDAIDRFNQSTASGSGRLIFGDIKDEAEAFKTIQQYLNNMGVTITRELGGKMEADAKGVYHWTATIRQANGEVQKLGFTFNKNSNQIRMGIKGIDKELVGLPKMIDQLKSKWSQLSVYWTSRAFDMQSMISYFRQGIQVVREYDDALVEMRKVQDESVETLREFQKESFGIANAVGTTGLQIQKSTADWLRLGKSFEEAKRAASETNVLMNVSEFTNIDEATQAMIAMKQAYDELDYRSIIDELNTVGNNFSISTSDLAQGLQNAAAALKTQGNSIEESIALITAGNSIIQDVQKVQAGIRTISLRIASSEISKKQLEELGEDVQDYIVQTRAKLQETIKSLTKTEGNKEGVNIIDPNGSLKSTYQILKEISGVYQEIQKEDKQFGTNRASALVEYLAGVFTRFCRNTKDFLCIMHYGSEHI